MRTVVLMARWGLWWCSLLTIVITAVVPPNDIFALAQSPGPDDGSKGNSDNRINVDINLDDLKNKHLTSQQNTVHPSYPDNRNVVFLKDLINQGTDTLLNSLKDKIADGTSTVLQQKNPDTGDQSTAPGSVESPNSNSSESLSSGGGSNVTLLSQKDDRNISSDPGESTSFSSSIDLKSKQFLNPSKNGATSKDTSGIGLNTIYRLRQFDPEEYLRNHSSSLSFSSSLSSSLPSSLSSNATDASNSSNDDDNDTISPEEAESWSSYRKNNRLPLLLNLGAADLFHENLTLVLEPISEFLSPGFVIQRVQGNNSWLEEFHEDQLDCYFSGFVLGHRSESNVGISLCDGARGIVQLHNVRYVIEPVKEPSPSSSTSTSSSSSTSSTSSSLPSSSSTNSPSSQASTLSSKTASSSSSSSSSRSSTPSPSSSTFHLLTQRIYIITKLPAKNVSTSYSCSITENFKHHRLKSVLKEYDEFFSSNVHSNDNVNINGNLYKKQHEENTDDVGSDSDFIANNNNNASTTDYDKTHNGTGSNGNGNGKGSSRRKRAVGVLRRHTVETLVVTDAKMYRFHGEDTQQYVLTLMSIVKNLYRHHSIGNHIDVVVVKLVIFEDERETPFSVVPDADSTLNNFCRWQERVNDHTPGSLKHHDTAILITREDICRAEGACETVGLAKTGTVCKPPYSCSLVEDSGISAAFTIAHELGHVLNLPHDDELQCQAYYPPNTVNLHLMAPQINSEKSTPWDWSLCSRKKLTVFLEEHNVKCLYDGAKVKQWDDVVKDTAQAGWIYPINKQCELIFGPGFKICPYNICEKIWCTNNSSKGCQSKHTPWANGSPCAPDKVCQEGRCVPAPLVKPKPINGGWGPWKLYGPCTRTCGGGIKKKHRECDRPVPQYGGEYCVGSRVRYKSCNIQDCPEGSTDFREVQCNSVEVKRKYMSRLPEDAVWKPDLKNVHIQNACKLYCGVPQEKDYIEVASKVIDGTKCEPLSDDVCVNGQCWKVGCDKRLGSTSKSDRCGVCNGDNTTCRAVIGSFNNAKRGINHVTTIPKGAREIDIRQYGTQRSVVDDKNYLVLKVSNGSSVVNGDWMIMTQSREVNVKGAKLSYTGTDVMVERLNTSMKIDEEIKIEVLSVGHLMPPNITFSYVVLVSGKVSWRSQGWTKCNASCNGRRRNKMVCTSEDNRIISRRNCRSLKKPHRAEERCNTHCQVMWKVFDEEECPVRCGTAMKRQLVHCIKRHGSSNAEIISDKHCKSMLGSKPDGIVQCTGKCLDSYWDYTDWSPCSRSCGDGVQKRHAKCLDESGKELNEHECRKITKTVVRKCNTGDCADWTTGNWVGCSVSCGTGFDVRKVWCTMGSKKMDESACSKKKKPPARKDCHNSMCPHWYPGGWGPCSASCGTGVSMRAVKCRKSDGFTQDSACNLSSKPEDKRNCFMGACPTPRPTTTTTLKTVAKAAYWRYGSWTECSSSCGSGTKYRYVTCMDYDRNHVADGECGHLAQPPKVENCMIKPCGDWREGHWSDCTVTCGEGIQTRYVTCLFNEQRHDDRFCDITIKPETETRCNRGTCLTPKGFDIGGITNNRVIGNSFWKMGSWSTCSVTCGNGWERRHVMCRGDRGGASKDCHDKDKPDGFRACNKGACPTWSIEEWSECSGRLCGDDGYQTRLVVCRLPNGDILDNSNCDTKAKAEEFRRCKTSCGEESDTTATVSTDTTKSTSTTHRHTNTNNSNNDNSGTDNNIESGGGRGDFALSPPSSRISKRPKWKRGPWSTCSATCSEGLRSRPVTCMDAISGRKLPTSHCQRKKPRDLKRCHRGKCPKWTTGRWSRCSVSCGKGLRKRTVRCQNRRHKYIDGIFCDHVDRPKSSTHCTRKECVQHMWKTGHWSECSRTCGFGQKHRSVTCADRAGKRMSPHLCEREKRPKVKRRCSEFPCPYIWHAGPWSECSTTCGEGKQNRNVFCQAVTKEGWILPGEVHYGCRQEEKMSTARYCNHGDCDLKHFWKVGPWGQCTVQCGFGRQKRSVICVNKGGEQVKRGKCRPLYRPTSIRTCYNGHCYASSCKEFKKFTTIRLDGEYRLKVGNRHIKIYCKNMRKDPEEYLTLPTGPQENFSENFDRRLRRPATCPNNGSRPAHDCVECRKKDYEMAGNTSFSKVRIDLRTLKLITSDQGFSNTSHGKFIPFGTAGDCYSSNNCPQGRFSINLLNTGFMVSPNVTWVLHGNRASQRIWKLKDGQIIRGVCGGNCGVCSPDSLDGLQLDLLR